MERIHLRTRRKIKAGAGQFQGAGKRGSLAFSETLPECQEPFSRYRIVVEEATWGTVAHRTHRCDLLCACEDASDDKNVNNDSDNNNDDDVDEDDN